MEVTPDAHISRRTMLTAGVGATTAALLPGETASARGHTTPERLLIKDGHVLTMDPELGDIDGGDVLVEHGRIADVGKNIKRPRGAEVIDASGALVMPGLIDNHKHMWESVVRGEAAHLTFGGYWGRILLGAGANITPDDAYVGTRLSAREALRAGVTTILDWDNAARTRAHAEHGVRALHDAGIRSVYAYGSPSSNTSGEQHPVSDEDIAAVYRLVGHYPLMGFAIATNDPAMRPGTEPRFHTDIERARALGVPLTIHGGFTGTNGQDSIVKKLADQKLLGPDMTFVHVNAITEADFRLAAEAGAHTSSSPPVELQMQFGDPPLDKMIAAGVHPTVSVDIPTAASSNMFEQLNVLLQNTRAMPKRSGPGATALTLTAKDMLPYVTTNAAASLNMQDRIGSLTPGKEADITMVRADSPATFLVRDPYEALVQYASPADVDTVLVAGRIVLRHGQLIGEKNLRHLQEKARTANKRLLDT